MKPGEAHKVEHVQFRCENVTEVTIGHLKPGSVCSNIYVQAVSTAGVGESSVLIPRLTTDGASPLWLPMRAPLASSPAPVLLSRGQHGAENPARAAANVALPGYLRGH